MEKMIFFWMVLIRKNIFRAFTYFKERIEFGRSSGVLRIVGNLICGGVFLGVAGCFYNGSGSYGCIFKIIGF